MTLNHTHTCHSPMSRYSTFAISDRPKYTTSPENMMHSVLIHEYYCRLDSNAVFVTVDTTLRSGRLEIKAYVRSKVGLPGKTEGVIFTPVPCEVMYFEPERVGVDLLLSTTKTQNSITPVFSDFNQIGRYKCVWCYYPNIEWFLDTLGQLM